MTQEANPYDSSSPGNLFVGYEALRKSVLKGLLNGKSYALLGGKRCGKTSFLLKLKEDLYSSSLVPFRVLPCFLDIKKLTPRSSFDFFNCIYTLTVEGLSVDRWDAPPRRQHYQEFLSRLDKVQPFMDQAYGSKWLVVLLIDELDILPSYLPGDECFQGLRNLLTASRYSSRFQVVASARSGLDRLITSSSPLNNADPEYTRILTLQEAHELIAVGFPQGLETQAEAELLAQTGRHPYALQELLRLLWEQPRPITHEMVRRAAWRFARARIETFKEWHQDLGNDGRACYEILARADGGTLGLKEIQSRTINKISVSEGLRTLGYHGLIDEEEPTQPRIAGTLFKEWFLDYSHSPSPPHATRDQVFISYSHKDKKWLERLETHLKPRIRNGKVDVWNDKRIKAGDEWRKEIDEALARAKVAVLLVSPHFLASDFIAQNELPPLLDAAKQEGVKILWVPVSTAAYKEAKIDVYQAVLDPVKPLDKHHHAHVSDAMETICKAISEVFSTP